MVLAELAAHLPANISYRVLATSGTKQGVDSLAKGCLERGKNVSLDTTVAYFPFDAPSIMKKAFDLLSPRLAVIVETELWPGFLYHAHKHGTPVLLINGRMSMNSFGSYKYLRNFFTKFGPDKVWAISQDDAARFSQIMGKEKIELMNNIKFDRISPPSDTAKQNPISAILPANIPFILLGSIRKEEEDIILATITRLQCAREDLIIGLFPKHIERADNWLSALKQKSILAVRRSTTTGLCQPGTVIVWDIFGELAGAYDLAKTAFIGGSLVNLGGQNFLEPLVFGLKPIIGPYWSNFSWVSRDILSAGLVYEVQNEKELCAKLLSELQTKESRELVIEQVQDFLAPRKGGTALVSLQLLNHLKQY